MDDKLGAETPLAFGFHPNAEIDSRTKSSSAMFTTLLELQPREAGGGEGAASPQTVAESVAQDVLDRFSERKYDVEDISRGIEDIGPYQNVFIQDMEVMNTLITEMVRSLKELQLGFSGALTMSDSMEGLLNALYVPLLLLLLLLLLRRLARDDYYTH